MKLTYTAMGKDENWWRTFQQSRPKLANKALQARIWEDGKGEEWLDKFFLDELPPARRKAILRLRKKARLAGQEM